LPEYYIIEGPENHTGVDEGSQWYIIVIAVIVFLALATGLVYLFIRKRKELQGYQVQKDGMEEEDIELTIPEQEDDDDPELTPPTDETSPR